MKKKKKAIFTNLKIQSKIKADNEIKENSSFSLTENYLTENYLTENSPFYLDNENVLMQEIFLKLIQKTDLIINLKNDNFLQNNAPKELKPLIEKFAKNYTKKEMFFKLEKNFKFIDVLLNRILFMLKYDNIENKIDFENFLPELEKSKIFLVEFPFEKDKIEDYIQLNYLAVFLIYCKITIILNEYHSFFFKEFKKNNYKLKKKIQKK